MRLNGFSIFWVASRMNPISRANHLWKSIQSGGRALTVRNIYATTHCCLFALGSTNFWASPQHQCVCVCVCVWVPGCVRAGVRVRVLVSAKSKRFSSRAQAKNPCWNRRTPARSTHFCALTPDRRKTAPAKAAPPCHIKPNQTNPTTLPHSLKNTSTHIHTRFGPPHTHTHAHLFVCIVQWQPSLIWFSYAEWNLRVEWMRRIQRPAVVGEHLYRGGFMNFVVFIIFYDSIY